MRESLENRLVVKLVFEHDTSPYVHVGAGRELGAGTLKALKIGGSSTTYLIPSTSLKGVLRRIADHIGKSLARNPRNLEEALLKCHCETEDSGIRHVGCSDSELKLISEYVEKSFRDGSIQRFLSEDVIERTRRMLRNSKVLQVLRKNHALEPLLAFRCPICRLYGGPGLGGKVFVNNVVITDGSASFITRASIERVSGRVREGALFTVEALTLPKFEVTLIVENIELNTLEPLIIAGTLEWLLKLGLEVGGMKSTGLGHYRLSTTESKGLIINYNNIKNSEDLIMKLTAIEKLLEDTGTSVDTLIKQLRQSKPM